MNWAAVAKIIMLKLPTVVMTAEKLKQPGVDKKAVVLDQLHQELHDVEPELAKHPKVAEVLGKVNDAVVEAANVITHVKSELDNQPKTLTINTLNTPPTE